ncbi:MAG: hydroxyacylglutathione hydrolase [Gammaproteobacteria bacterium]
MITIQAVPAFKDNYIWLISRPGTPYAAIVDPGDAQPVFDALDRLDLIPCAILVTHHHWDHTNGIAALLGRYPVPVYGPATENIPGLTHGLRHGDRVSLPEIDVIFDVLHVPGHTLGAIAFYGNDALFCGDTLFTAGCGRLFEGTAAQMHASLAKLAALPDETQVYCGHEYTVANLRFAEVVEPVNREIQVRLVDAQALRAKGIPTVPASLAEEKRTNPFLRSEMPVVVAAAERFTAQRLETGAEVFAAVRRWKDVLDG